MSIELSGSGGAKEVTQAGGSPSDDALLRLARLIGRQIAREQFDRNHVKERRTTARGDASKEW